MTTGLFSTLIPNQTNVVYIAFFQFDSDENTVYTDLIGKFSVTLLAGNRYMLILYHYDTNAIFTKPMVKNLTKNYYVFMKHFTHTLNNMGQRCHLELWIIKLPI